MRSMLIAAIAVVGLGLLGTSGAFAAPANGTLVRDALATTSSVQDVRTCIIKFRHKPFSRRDKYKFCN